MNRPAHGLVLAALLTLASATARADVITFDDLTDPSGVGTPIANGYKGFDWSNFSVLDGTSYPAASGFNAGVVSPAMVAFNVDGRRADITSATDFDFVGAAFTAAWRNNLQLRIRGYDDGVKVFDQTFTLGTSGPTWINANLSSIDELRFQSSGGVPATPSSNGHHFAMDSFTYTRDGLVVADVPEPGSLVLLGLGVGGTVLYGLARRRRRQPQADSR
jgi:hypothetical protein